MPNHLVLYASQDGQTARIASAIGKEMENAGLTVELKNLETIRVGFNLFAYDSVLLGAPIRYGHHLQLARRFISAYQAQLSCKPNGFFSVNLTARKPEKQQPETNRYMQRFLQRSPWQPKYRGVLAGSLPYSRYTWYDRVMIQLIMKLTGGNADTSKSIEYTDWSKVKTFARGYVAYLQGA